MLHSDWLPSWRAKIGAQDSAKPGRTFLHITSLTPASRPLVVGAAILLASFVLLAGTAPTGAQTGGVSLIAEASVAPTIVRPLHDIYVKVTPEPDAWLDTVTANGAELAENDDGSWGGYVQAPAQTGPLTIYVEALDVYGNTDTLPASCKVANAYAANMKDLYKHIMISASANFRFKIWGTITATAEGSIAISDGAGSSALLESDAQFTVGSKVIAEGVLDRSSSPVRIRFAEVTDATPSPISAQERCETLMRLENQLSVLPESDAGNVEAITEFAQTLPHVGGVSDSNGDVTVKFVDGSSAVVGTRRLTDLRTESGPRPVRPRANSSSSAQARALLLAPSVFGEDAVAGTAPNLSPIADMFADAGYCEPLELEAYDCSIPNLRNVKDYDAVVFYGHGSSEIYLDLVTSDYRHNFLLVTGEKVVSKDRLTADYKDDIEDGSIIPYIVKIAAAPVQTRTFVCISGRFIRKYWKLRTNSLFFAAACHSAEPFASDFAAACHEKNTGLYVGLDGAAQAAPLADKIQSVIPLLLGESPGSGNTHTPPWRAFSYGELREYLANNGLDHVGAAPLRFSFNPLGGAPVQGGLMPSIQQVSAGSVRLAEGLMGLAPFIDCPLVWTLGDMGLVFNGQNLGDVLSRYSWATQACSGSVCLDYKGLISNKRYINEYIGAVSKTGPSYQWEANFSIAGDTGNVRAKPWLTPAPAGLINFASVSGGTLSVLDWSNPEDYRQYTVPIHTGTDECENHDCAQVSAMVFGGSVMVGVEAHITGMAVDGAHFSCSFDASTGAIGDGSISDGQTSTQWSWIGPVGQRLTTSEPQ